MSGCLPRRPNRVRTRRSLAIAAALSSGLVLLAISLPPLFFARVARADALDAEPIVIPPPSDAGSSPDGPAYPVRRFELVYQQEHPDQPPLDEVLPVTIELTPTASGYAAARAEQPSEAVVISNADQKTALFHASAIGAISRDLVSAVHDAGLLGIYVMPDPKQIDAQSERDLRAPGDLTLRFIVWSGRVREVRTVAVGDRIKGDWIINNEAHARIRRESPMQPAHVGPKGATDVLRSDVLEDYLFQLNRHPGRYVEAALAASEDEKGIALDYRVHEMRPWSVYAQTGNTGTPRTAVWQTRVGFINRQLLGRDDIFSLEYLNAGLDKVHGVTGSYDAPWFRRTRPSWLKKSGFEPRWLSWLNRDKIPWWGSNRLRWRMGGAWSRFQINADEDAPNSQDGTNEFETNDWFINGQLIYNFWQHRNFFLDGFGGMQYRNAEVDDLTSSNDGNARILSGDLGFRFERIDETSTLLGLLYAELGSTDDNLEFIGRDNADDRWNVIHWDFGLAQYMEPIFDPKSWRDPSTARSSTLAHEFAIGLKGQYAFDYRLIPQASQVVGGLYTIRGFEQGIAVGDSVYIGTIEYRFHLPRALPVRREPMQLPYIGDFRAAPQQVYGRPDWDLILRVFSDAGRTIRNQRPNAVARSEANQTLVSAGVGIEAVFRGKISARVDWARGLYYDVDQFCKPAPGFPCPFIDDSIDKSGYFNFLFSIMY